jgi:S1-C subfamily serine protease/tetratricopeptide (TPR) repeat protein
MKLSTFRFRSVVTVASAVAAWSSPRATAYTLHAWSAVNDDELPRLVARVKPSVATLVVFGPGGSELKRGTGFVIAHPTQPNKNVIVTNHHVIAGGTSCQARFAGGQQVELQGVLAESAPDDLAVLWGFSGLTEFPAIPVATKVAVEGQKVVFVGTPLGTLSHTVTDGIVSAIRSNSGACDLIQTNAAISPGSSGSPMLSISGELLGIARGSIEAGQSINFAVSAQCLSSLKFTAVRSFGSVRVVAQPAAVNIAEECRIASRAISDGRIDIATESITRILDWEAANPPVLDLGCVEDLLETLSKAAVPDDQLRRAIPVIKRAVEMSVASLRVTRSLAWACQRAGMFQDAEAAYRQVLAQSSSSHDFLEGRLGLSQVLEALGKHEESIAVGFEARNETPTAELLVSEAVFDVLLRRYARALAATDWALRLQPKATHARLFRGRALVGLGQYERAIAELQSAIAEDRDEIDGRFDLADAFKETGRAAERKDVLEQILALTKTSTSKARDNVFRLWIRAQAHQELGNWSLAVGSYKSALSALERALKNQRDDELARLELSKPPWSATVSAKMQCDLAETLLQSGQAADAGGWVASARRASNEIVDAEAKAALEDGDMARKRGESARAVSLWKRAALLDPSGSSGSSARQGLREAGVGSAPSGGARGSP